MSDEQQQDLKARLSYITQDHAPDAQWTVGGVFRFDTHLITMLEFFETYFPPRRFSRVAGTPPCAWSLDFHAQHAPLTVAAIKERVRVYAEENVGLVIVFDNPSPPPESMEDEYCHRIVQELFAKGANPTGRNAVCVASDALAELLRKRYLGIRLICHANRLVMANEKRTPGFYGKLETLYDEIVLHPRDAVSPQVYAQLAHPEKYSAVLNDPTPRNFPTRRELLNLLAERRRRPYDASLIALKERMLSRSGMYRWENSGNLTRREEQALYDAGVRSFALQSGQFRNELTFWYDCLYHMLRTQPEHSNKSAFLASAALSYIRETPDKLPSGLTLFSFTDPEHL